MTTTTRTTLPVSILWADGSTTSRDIDVRDNDVLAAIDGFRARVRRELHVYQSLGAVSFTFQITPTYAEQFSLRSLC